MTSCSLACCQFDSNKFPLKFSKDETKKKLLSQCQRLPNCSSEDQVVHNDTRKEKEEGIGIMVGTGSGRGLFALQSLTVKTRETLRNCKGV